MTPPKGYKHTELGVLPEDWEVVRLGDVCEIQSGGTPSRKIKKYWENGTIKWLGSSVCKNQNRIDEITDYITEEGLKNSSAKIFSKGTTLIALVGATIGKVAYLPFEASTNQNIAGLQPNKRVANDKFIFYSSLMLYRHFETLSSDKFKMANLSFVRNLQIPLPPLAEQEKIAEILSTWDTQIQNFETLITEKQALKKGLCQTLLTAKTRLKGFSEDWEVVRLGEVCEICNGFAFQSKKFKKSGFPIVRISNIKSNNSISLKDMVYFSFDDYKNKDLNKFAIHQNDILVALSGATTGKIGKLKENIVLYLNQRVGKFQPLKRLNNNFLYQNLLLQSELLFLLSGGGAQPNLSTTTIKDKIFISLPSLAEQEKIAEILGEADNEITLLEQKLESLKSQKRGLMQNLLNGKVRV